MLVFRCAEMDHWPQPHDLFPKHSLLRYQHRPPSCIDSVQVLTALFHFSALVVMQTQTAQRFGRLHVGTAAISPLLTHRHSATSSNCRTASQPRASCVMIHYVIGRSLAATAPNSRTLGATLALSSMMATQMTFHSVAQLAEARRTVHRDAVDSPRHPLRQCTALNVQTRCACGGELRRASSFAPIPPVARRLNGLLATSVSRASVQRTKRKGRLRANKPAVAGSKTATGPSLGGTTKETTAPTGCHGVGLAAWAKKLRRNTAVARRFPPAARARTGGTSSTTPARCGHCRRAMVMTPALQAAARNNLLAAKW